MRRMEFGRERGLYRMGCEGERLAIVERNRC